MRAPILVAVARIERENVVLGGSDQRVIDHDRTGLETCVLLGIVNAEHLQPVHILRVDLGKRGIAPRGKCLVIAWPVRVFLCRNCRRSCRRDNRPTERCGGYFGGDGASRGAPIMHRIDRHRCDRDDLIPIRVHCARRDTACDDDHANCCYESLVHVRPSDYNCEQRVVQWKVIGCSEPRDARVDSRSRCILALCHNLSACGSVQTTRTTGINFDREILSTAPGLKQ